MFFVDVDGLPKLKDSNNTVTNAAQSGQVTLNEVGSAPSPQPSKVLVYAKSVGGVSQPFFMPPNGIEVTFAGPRINWKNGTPGNPYVAGDTVNALFGDIVMVNVADPDTLTVNLPAITAASATQLVQIRNLVDKKGPNPGQVLMTPAVTDAIELFSTGQAVYPGSPVVHFSFESDGVGRWNFSILGGGFEVLTAPAPPPI
jgi:hypothetical protein